MPIHVVAGFLTAIGASFAGVIGLLYALWSAPRAALRAPLVLASSLSAAGAVWAAAAGAGLYAGLGGSPELQGTITAKHAENGDILAAVAITLLVVAVPTAWRWLAPNRPSGGWRSRTARIALAATSACLAVVTAITVSTAMQSVWLHHSPWGA